MQEAVYLSFFLWTLPYWLPVVWVAYFLGRRKFSLLALFLLITFEAVAIWLSLWLPNAVSDYWPNP